jgi:hypothetical protein
MPLNGWTPYVAADWEMLPNSGRTQHGVGDANADELIYVGPWLQRFSFAQAKTRALHPSLPGCYCGRINIYPRDPQLPPTTEIGDVIDELPQYAKGSDPWAVAVCRYSTDFSVAPWPSNVTKPTIEAGTTLRFERRAGGQFLSMRPEDMKHEQNTEGSPTGPKWRKDSQAGRKLIVTGEYHLTWLYVQEPPISCWRDTMIGHVNADYFLDCPPETLLFDDFDIRPSIRFDLLDPFCWEVTIILRERRIKVGDDTYGWNHEYGPGNDGVKWYRVKMDNGAGAVRDRYDKEVFANMFQSVSCSSSSGT